MYNESELADSIFGFRYFYLCSIMYCSENSYFFTWTKKPKHQLKGTKCEKIICPRAKMPWVPIWGTVDIFLLQNKINNQFVASELGSLHKLRLYFLAFDHVRTPPSLHFLCSKFSIFLTTYLPLNANVICEGSLRVLMFFGFVIYQKLKGGTLIKCLISMLSNLAETLHS